MPNKVFVNTIPQNSTNRHKATEDAVLEGLKNRDGCTVSILENPERFEITVKIESVEGSWSRKFSPGETQPDFIRRAVENVAFK
jgi:hypothetical protein